jgi:HSP20 family protein
MSPTLCKTPAPTPATRRRRNGLDLWDGFFDSLFESPLLRWPVGVPGAPSSALSFAPRLDLTEGEKGFTLTAEMPGLTKEDIELELREDALVLRGEKKPEPEADEETVLHTERRWGRFERSLRLPADIDPDAVEASFRNGVLVVNLPKASPGGGPRKIQVND